MAARNAYGCGAYAVEANSAAKGQSELTGSCASALSHSGAVRGEWGRAGRIQYEPIDFVRDALPVGFDAILECGVGVHNQALFSKTLSALNRGGRLVIIDQFAPETGVAPSSRLSWALADSLANPDSVYPTVQEIRDMLALAGYHQLSCRLLPQGDAMRCSEGWQVIEARQ